MGTLDHVKLRLVENFSDVEDLFRWLGERREVLGCDTETGGLEWWSNELRLVQFGDLDSGWVVPWQLWGGAAKEVLERYSGDVVFHNAQFDLRFLEESGVDVRDLRGRVHDTSIMAHVLDSTRKRALKFLGEKLVDRNSTRGQELLHEGMQKNKWTWATVPVGFPAYWAYSALDPVITAHLYQQFKPKIDTRFSETYELEMAVSHILSAMERRGLLVDQDYTNAKRDAMVHFEEQMLDYLGQRWPELKRERGSKDKREEYVALGNDTIAKILLEEGAPLTKTTPSGKFSVDDEVLSGLSADFELAGCITQLRQAKKFRASYFDAILANLHEGRVRPSINPLGARTGRMSVSRPPFQQLPSGSPLVRDCVIPAEGNRLLSVDYDQIELRVLAHMANVPSMIEAIHAGDDMHWSNARMIFGPTEDKKHRKMAKTGAFGKVYGAGPSALASQLGITVGEAQAFVNRFDAALPEVPGYARELEAEIRERQAGGSRGYVMTHFGRRCYVDSGKEYAGLNYRIQGTAAEILKRQLVQLDRAGLSDYALLPVHDEVIFEVPERDAASLLQEIGQVMTDSTSFVVPISASGEAVSRWGDAYAPCKSGNPCTRSFCGH